MKIAVLFLLAALVAVSLACDAHGGASCPDGCVCKSHGCECPGGKRAPAHPCQLSTECTTDKITCDPHHEQVACVNHFCACEPKAHGKRQHNGCHNDQECHADCHPNTGTCANNVCTCN